MTGCFCSAIMHLNQLSFMLNNPFKEQHWGFFLLLFNIFHLSAATRVANLDRRTTK